MNRIARRSFVVMLLTLLVIAGMAFFVYEYATQAEDWILFAGSPHVYNSGKIDGGYVLDKNGTPIANMSGSKAFSSDASVRKAMLHWLGDREGNVSTPALTEYSLEMTGYDLLNGIYTYGDSGYQLTLTLCSQVQKVALEAMGNYHGTIAVYNYRTGQLLCAVSTPTFDPDNVPVFSDEVAFDGVYVNRFTQASYVPGSIFKIVTLAAAMEVVSDLQTRTFTCYGIYEYGVDAVTCEQAHYDQTVREAFANSCNCAFAQLTELMGQEKMSEYAQRFGINDSLVFDGIITQEGHYDVTGAEPVELAWSGIGQYTDAVSPAQFLTFMGAIAAGGQGVQPYLVEQITVGENATYTAQTQTGKRIMKAETASLLKDYLRNNVESVYGDWNFPGLSVCAKSGTGEVGEGRRPNATFAGFVDDPQYPLAFFVAVEDAGYGSQVCVPILAPVLEACKLSMEK